MGHVLSTCSNEALRHLLPLQPQLFDPRQRRFRLVLLGLPQLPGSSPADGGSSEGAGEHRSSLHLLFPPRAAAGLPTLRPEVHSEEAVDQGVKARVEEAKEEENVAEGWGHLLPGQHLGGEPVPQAEQVVRSPADDESQDDDGRHLEGAHAHPRNVVVGAAEVELPGLW